MSTFKLPNKGNQHTTKDSNYSMENMSELFDIDKIPEDDFSITYNIIDQYQQK